MKLHAFGRIQGLSQPLIGKITTEEIAGEVEQQHHVLMWRSSAPPENASGYLAILVPTEAADWHVDAPVVSLPPGLEYLADGDVVSIYPSGFIRTLYRKNSPHNFILATDQCNSFCLMCSQPPKQINDFDRIGEHFRLIDLIDPDTCELGITGGEPTLLKDGFLELVSYCKAKLPKTALHVLTNGRLFYYREFARRLGAIEHPDLMLGIPLYSDIDSEHDYVVQARGAFEETMLGLYYLDHSGVAVEIRVVIHKQTYQRLPKLAEFIARNLPFASHVALMGMEMFGFVHKNFNDLWIDPYAYQPELLEAAEILTQSGLSTSIYNHQLCVLDRVLWPLARKSISDWKNIYLEPCNLCSVREQCGGLFQSAAKRHSSHIAPIL